MPLHFLVDEPGARAGDAQPGDDVVLRGAEAHHAATVRRVRVGEEVTVGDGRGAWLTGECVAVASGEVIVRVTARRDVAAPSPRLVLVQALAKGDRDELAVQAATELGADEIVPWQAARSVARWNGVKAGRGQARWAGIVREAAKQAHRAWVPAVAPLESTTDLLRRADTSRMIVLDPAATTRMIESLSGHGDIVIVVGPEGGIADDELRAFEDAGARPAVLGDTVLRTSTAGPAALAVASAAIGRW